MKQHAASGVLLAVLLATAACGAPDRESPRAERQGSGWITPPRIESVERAGAALLFRGRAEPGARVVLTDATGAAFATSADDQGRFELSMGAPTTDLVLTPEVRRGQTGTPAPERLLVLAGGRGPVAVLSPGAATRRLDRPGPLEAVDSDSRMVVLSGRAPPASELTVSVGGRDLSARSDDAGRWTLPADLGLGPITVGGREYVYPGPVGSSTSVRAGAGWAIRWTAPDGAAQSTWLPD